MEYTEGMYNKKRNQVDRNKVRFNNEFGEKWAQAECSEMADSEQCERKKKAAHEYAIYLIKLKSKVNECQDIYNEAQTNPFIENNFLSCVEQLEYSMTSHVDSYYEIFKAFDRTHI